jgi:hypothetical protein
MMDMPRDTVLIRPASDRADAYPAPHNTHAFRAYFEREGFIKVSRAIAPELCEAAKQAFLNEMLSSNRAYFLRHISGRHERHVYTEQGFMKYPIMNFQDIPQKRYPKFKEMALIC